MLSSSIGAALAQARKRKLMSRETLAQQAGVSTRLVADFERGARPNVSLETALRLLQIVGLSTGLDQATHRSEGLSDTDAARIDRAARAAQRRATWVGSRTSLSESDAPPPPSSPAERLAAVREVSQRVFAISQGTLTASPVKVQRRSK